jgi:hypothetical protein
VSVFGFLKRLKLRSGYGYTSAAKRSGRSVGERAIRTAKEIFAEGVDFGRSLEREEKKVVRKVKGRKWRGR